MDIAVRPNARVSDVLEFILPHVLAAGLAVRYSSRVVRSPGRPRSGCALGLFVPHAAPLASVCGLLAAHLTPYATPNGTAPEDGSSDGRRRHGRYNCT